MYSYAHPYQQRHGYGYPSYSYYDDDYAPRDYYQALAQQQARERLEAQYRANLEEARRRRAYEEELARAQAQKEAAAEAARRHRYAYDPFLGGLDYDDYDEPYSSFLRPDRYTSRRTNGPTSAGMDRGGGSPRHDFLEDLIGQQMAARDEGQGVGERRPQMHTRPGPNSPKGSPPKSSHMPAGRHMHERSVSPSKKVHIETEEQKEIPRSTPRSPSPNTVLRNDAARRIQEFVRVQLPRLSAFKAIKKISDQFDDIKLSFQFPDTLDFTDAKSDPDAVPDLLYTHRNAPVHGHEHALTKLLSKLDEVDSLGDSRIRRARKQLVKKIEEELNDLDAKKVVVWKKTRLEASLDMKKSVPAPEPEPAKEVDSGYGSEGPTGAAELVTMESDGLPSEPMPQEEGTSENNEAAPRRDDVETPVSKMDDELKTSELKMDDESQAPESKSVSETSPSEALSLGISSEEANTPTQESKNDDRTALDSEPMPIN